MDLAGKWHIGNLAILPEDIRHLKKGHYISNDAGLPFAYQVRPETVGQYIGRPDEEGKDLYEGQRVKFTNLSLGLYSEDELWAEGVIAFDPEGSGYFISQEKGDGWKLRHSRVVALDDEGEAAKA